jgi:signal transduction histidine kinase/CheY-like chemotaxis protein
MLRRPAGGAVASRVVAGIIREQDCEHMLVTAVLPGSAPVRVRSEEEMMREAKRESIELLAGGVAHDFNNLLTAILGNIGLARMESGHSAEVSEWLAEAEKASLRARDLTQQLLTFSKGGEPVRRLVALGVSLRDAAQFARQGSRVRCEFEIAPDLWPAEVDLGQISQVVHNLVLNAVQAMPQGGVVTISACNLEKEEMMALGVSAQPGIVISVRDQGPGIRKEDMQKIFQPYFTTKPRGSGLGLATSHTIARRHRGALRVDSVDGHGATFSLYLPAKPGASTASPSLLRERGEMRGRILVMDDEESIRQVVPLLLQRLGFETVVVRDGTEAVEAVARSRSEGVHYDLVILDLTVPAGLGAVETLPRLREIDSKLRVIISSGYAEAPAMRDPQAHGFDGCVKKPYCMDELVTVFARLVSAVGLDCAKVT